MSHFHAKCLIFSPRLSLYHNSDVTFNMWRSSMITFFKSSRTKTCDDRFDDDNPLKVLTSVGCKLRFLCHGLCGRFWLVHLECPFAVPSLKRSEVGLKWTRYSRDDSVRIDKCNVISLKSSHDPTVVGVFEDKRLNRRGQGAEPWLRSVESQRAPCLL